MEVLNQTLKSQGETAVTLQREQHVSLERMADRANDTQVSMMVMLAGGKSQPQITDKPAPPGSQAAESARDAAGTLGYFGLDTSFESRFEDMDETDMTAPPLIDTNFLIKELWDPQMLADFAFCRFEGPRMTECQQEINNVLRHILFPFPVPEKSRLPGEWIPFEHFKLHPASNEESWITNHCASLVWYYGLQGWYILTGAGKQDDPRRVPGNYEQLMDCTAILEAHQQWQRGPTTVGVLCAGRCGQWPHLLAEGGRRGELETSG
eukprot:484332-Rhodomonas_salina.1